jgi:glycosyltransferase involved in cell wall biosynthesis
VSVFSSGFRLRKLLLQTKASHLVLNDFYLLQGVICRILGFRGQIITWVRVEPNRTGGRLTSILWALIGLSSNQVISVSHFVEQQIPAWLKTVVIYDCLSLQPDFHSKPARLGRIVYLGNLMPGKGQNYAVEAFAAVADRFPNAVLEFHGGTLGVESNKIWEQQLQRRCKELGLERRISFHGAYSNPFVPLRGADVALNFSDSETFSFTVLEALAAGVPVIATNSGGPAELIDDQVTGVLVLIGDRDAMAQALAERLSDLDATAAMGRAAAQNMAQRFSMEAYRNHLLALLKI